MDEQLKAGGYLNAWNALASMLENGRSLSGRERNCCFLNTQDSKFANVSAISGFDFPDDTRSVCLTDWDQDGDLDVWMTNRTAPRVRFLQNRTSSEARSVLLQVQGIQCNRDGIGARVEVRLDDGRPPLLRTLRAGEGYLGQGSKWLHFGLGAADIEEVHVRWPSGDREVFRGVEDGGRFVLAEHTGVAKRLPSRPTKLRTDIPQSVDPPRADSIRLVLPAPMPMPRLVYRNLQNQERALNDATNKPLLVNLWSTTCQPCLEEIAEWSTQQRDFQDAGLRVALVCVDGATTTATELDAEKTGRLLARLGSSFPAGMATPELLDALDIAQLVLTRRIRTLPIPTSFLLNQQGRLAVVYKGPVSSEQLLADVARLSMNPEEQRNFGVGFSGQWYTNPFPPDVLAIPQKYQQLGQPERALSFLKLNAPTSINANSVNAVNAVTAKSLANAYIGLAKELQSKEMQAEVLDALQIAAQLQPQDGQIRTALAMALSQAGRAEDAASHYREFIQAHPNDFVMMNNLAWLLATCNVNAVRRPNEAIDLAEVVCQRSQRKLPSALDTLAAAYAAAGRFEDAEATVREAIELLEAAGQKDYSFAMRKRLDLYQRKQAYVDNP